MGRGTKIALGIGGGCLIPVLLALFGLVGCLAVLGSGAGTDSKSGAPDKSGASGKNEITVGIGEPVTVGDVTWRVTNATQSNQLKQQGAPSGFGKTKQGNFVIVDFDFTNNGSDPATLNTTSLALIDNQGRESTPDPDQFFYISQDRNIFLENINPGVMRQGQTIFEIASGASGFKLQAGDAAAFTDKNGYIDLGF